MSKNQNMNAFLTELAALSEKHKIFINASTDGMSLLCHHDMVGDVSEYNPARIDLALSCEDFVTNIKTIINN
jgi:hypothetical protein